MAGIGALFSGAKSQVAPTVRMPDQQDPAAIEAVRRKQRQTAQTTGRASTDLTGGDAYTNTVLGA